MKLKFLFVVNENTNEIRSEMSMAAGDDAPRKNCNVCGARIR